MKETRILISGAGIAGFTLAYWLKQYGYSPTIIEKHSHLREGGYKVDVRGTALEVAKRMGIYQDLIKANVNIERSKFVTPKLKVFEFDGDILGYCSDGDIEVNRWDLTQILSKAVGDIEIIYDDSITKIDELVHFEKGEARKFDLVIGADGQYSNVRQLVFEHDAEVLKRYGIHFCVFPIANIFNLNRCEIVYFDKGRFIAAYAVDNHSYACFAFKSDIKSLPSENPKDLFVKHFNDLGWEAPQLIKAMNNSTDCYFNSIAQVRMPHWSKGNVALVGDAAHAVSGMGTSLAMVGAYVLAKELNDANGIYTLAFERYENTLRHSVEEAQNLAESNQQLLEDNKTTSFQFYLMKLLPKNFIKLMTKKGREKMKKVANILTLEA